MDFHRTCHLSPSTHDFTGEKKEFLSLMSGIATKYAPTKTSLQEKRKIPAVPNGTAAHGEAEPHGGHSGPELQRTGRLVGTTRMGLKCVSLSGRNCCF